MSLNSERSREQQRQDSGDNHQFKTNSLGDTFSWRAAALGLRVAAPVPTAFPLASNYCGCRAGFALRQVSGSNRSGKIGRLGKVFTLFSIRVENAVATRGGSAPDSNCSVFGNQCEGIFGVNSLNRLPANKVLNPNITNCYGLIISKKLWKPKQQHGYPGQQRREWQCSECGQKPLVYCNQNNCNQQQRNDNCGQHPAEARIEPNVHLPIVPLLPGVKDD